LKLYVINDGVVVHSTATVDYCKTK